MGADVCRQLLNHQQSSPDAGTLSARNYISHNASLWGLYGACTISPGLVKRTTAAVVPIGPACTVIAPSCHVFSNQASDWSSRLPGRPVFLSEPTDLPRPGGGGPGSRLMVGGGGKMAELMLLSEIADPTRFFTDNLLSPEDWDSTLYSGLDEVAEEQTQLFRCVEQDVPFDSGSLDVGMDVSPPEPPWDALPIFPDLQVKSEPSSPCSSSSLSSESSHVSTEPSSSQVPGVGEVLHVKTESLAPPLCLLGDDPASPFETVQITVGSASDDLTGNHALNPSTREAEAKVQKETISKSEKEVKPEY